MGWFSWGRALWDGGAALVVDVASNGFLGWGTGGAGGGLKLGVKNAWFLHVGHVGQACFVGRLGNVAFFYT